MAKRTILFLAVVAFCAFTVSAFADYWTWTHAFLPLTKTTTNGAGFFPGFAPLTGQLNPDYGDYGQQNTIQTSPADGTPAATYLSISDINGVLIRPDGFSFNNDIAGWVGNPLHALMFSTAQNYREAPPGASYYSETTDGETITTVTTVDGPGLDLGGPYNQTVGRAVANPNAPPTYLQTYIPNVLGPQFTNNDDVRVIDQAGGWEVIIQHAEAQDYAAGTLGVLDLTWWSNMSGVKHQAGRMETQQEYAMGDFDVTDSEPGHNERIYFSAGRYIATVSAYRQVYRPNATWVGGSDYQGNANAGDVLTQYIDPDLGTVTRGVFEKAWKIAGTMVGDRFWLPANGSLVWNTWKCYVSTSSASNAPEAAGHEVVRNFMRYVFDITAMKVQDYDGDGMFDAGQDLILFSVMDDSAQDRATTYNEGWGCSAFFAGKFFDGDTIFLYNGASVVTYMDPSTGIFYGNYVSTGLATIWGEKYGAYNLTGFDLTYAIPEPSTIILIAGATLALGAGILRKKLR
jgi:hypothetical protein